MKTLKQYLKYKKQPSISINEKLVIFPSQVNEKLVIFPSQVDEKLVINKNTKLYNNEVFDKIESIKSDDDLYDTVEYIAKSGRKSGKNDPALWDDSGEFATRDYFEPWEDNFGKSDDMYEVIERFCDDNIVIGWKNYKSFDELDKIVPEFINDITDTWKSRIIHQKMNCTATVWEEQLGKHKCNLLKLNMHVNDNGRDYMEYWYMFIIE